MGLIRRPLDRSMAGKAKKSLNFRLIAWHVRFIEPCVMEGESRI